MSVAWLLEFLKLPREELKKDENFLKRLRVQKAAYLLKYLGVQPFTRYDFSLYIHGPYSPDLAREYYSEKSEGSQVPEIDNDILELLKWFMDHGDRWLEIATSILMIRERYPEIGAEEILSILRLSKPWITDSEFGEILGELRSKPQLKL
jgi:uncharacterized protein YwgA